MIRFKGSISKKNKRKVRNKMYIVSCASVVLVNAIMLPGLIMIGYIFFAVMVSVLSVVLGLAVCLCVGLFIPNEITIENGNCIFIAKSGKTEIPVEKIRKVTLKEDLYCFYYTSPDWINIMLVCQKDMIVEGTIEEFEALFADILIKDGEDE